ncbi:MAG: DUF3450 family protein [Verrucomicrobiota bacterium]
MAVAFLQAQEASPVTQTKSKLDKWVETQQLISEVKNEWAIEKELLQDTVTLLTDERDTLDERIKNFEEGSNEADKRRDELLLARVEYKNAQNALEEQITGLEKKLLALIPTLPAPLRSKLNDFIVRIPEDPAKANITLSERLVNLVAVLRETERFNRDVHLFGVTERIDGEDSEPRQVWRIYWGLAGSYYVDEQGELGGAYLRTDDGWVSQADNSLASDLSLLRNIKEGTEDQISFIQLPLTVK